MMQRFLDILFSSLALILLSPLLILVILLLRLTGEGEIVFLQPRVGRNGEIFYMWKFVTMVKNSPEMGTGTVTIKNDPRVLPVGHFLRKTKLNELPQLVNILKGDMSFIGPRPQTRRCFDAFPKIAQMYIKQVRPGLSGIGSIVFRDEEEIMSNHPDVEHFYDSILMPYKGNLEIWYVKNPTMRNYFKLLFLTFWVILKPKSQIVRLTIKDLPETPVELQAHLNLQV